MPKAQRRSWIKLYCYERLHGSVAFQLEPDERSVWDELLCFAGLCGLDGLIADHDKRPFPHSYIAHELHITEELLERTLAKCKEEGRVKEDEHGIHITNWTNYQSEYQRQKPYRDKKRPHPIKDRLYCPKCHYNIEDSPATANLEICPQCHKKGKEVKLEKRSNP